MTPALGSMLLIWVVLFIYALAASVDFGAGFWAMLLSGRKDGAADVANRYVSPLWEVTNVFLILFTVGFVGFFPQAAFVYGSVLLLPGSLILILLALRGSFLVFAYTTKNNANLLRIVSGLTGLLLPSLFISVLPISEGGFVTLASGSYQLQAAKLFSSPIEYAYLLFGLSTELFFSSLLMADYSLESGNQNAYRTYRNLAVWIGPAMLVTALTIPLLMPADGRWLQLHLFQTWPAFLISLLAFGAGYGALWLQNPHQLTIGRPRLAVTAIAIQYAIAQFAYGYAHLPFLLYPYLSVESAFTNGPMFESLLMILIAGLAVIFPAFIWVWRLFMQDPRYVTGGGKKS